MRVVFLTCHLPYPPLSGGRRREYELLRRIEHEVHVVAVSKTAAQDRDLAPVLMDRSPAVRTVTVLSAATPPGRWRLPARLPSLVARHRCPTATAVVAAAGQGADLLHVEGFYLMQHVPEAAPGPILLIEQNIEWQLCAQRRDRRDTARTQAAEIVAWRRATALGALTADDASIMRAATGGEVALVPNGIDPITVNRRDPDPATVLFVSNFTYQPNRDAAQTLVREILPRIRRTVPRVRLLLVGNDSDGEMARRYAGPGCEVLGWVPSLTPFYQRATVVVCPLRIGGGVKVKMLEAFAHGKAIVTTPIGLQGLDQAVHATRVATGPTALASCIIDVLVNPSRRRALEHAAEAFSLTLGSWDEAAAALNACWRRAARSVGDTPRWVPSPSASMRVPSQKPQ